MMAPLLGPSSQQTDGRNEAAILVKVTLTILTLLVDNAPAPLSIGPHQHAVKTWTLQISNHGIYKQCTLSSHRESTWLNFFGNV